MPRRKTLLIGNGINRLDGSGASWEDVLRATASYVGKPNIMRDWNLKSLPLLYEELYSEHVGKKKRDEFELKQFVADEVAKVTGSDYHRRVVDKGVRNVITTNYDLSLEKSREEGWKKANLHRETKYSRYRRNKVLKTCVWHIHGASDAPNTIQLGHEHYSGQLQYLRSLVVGFGKSGYNKAKSAFLQGEQDFDDLNLRHSWLDVFFRDDIHIFGLGLDFSEIDIWWAIAYKNRLKNGESRAKKSKRAIAQEIGSTTFHELEKTADKSNERVKQEVLKSLGVTVKLYAGRGSYKGMFDNLMSLF